MKYRSRTEIITMILDSARTGTTKTKIMYKAYLSYGQLQDYLKFLLANEFLICEEGTQLHRTTEKGLRYLNMSYQMNELVTASDSKHYKAVLNQ